MNINSVRNRNLSELLPYNPAEKRGDQLLFALNEYFLLLNAAKYTITALENDFSKIEPLVGECQCHIRADIISSIALPCIRSFKENHVLEKIQDALHKISNYFESSSNLEEIIQQELKIELSGEELFLIKAYLLTVVRNANNTKIPDLKEITSLNQLQELIPEGRNSFWETFKEKLKNIPKNYTQANLETAVEDILTNAFQMNLSDDELLFIKKFLSQLIKPKSKTQTTSVKNLLTLSPLSRVFKNDLVSKLRRDVSQQSVEWTQRRAHDIGDQVSREMLSTKYIVKHDGLTVAPTYWTIKVFLNDEAPLVIWHQQFEPKSRGLIRESCFYYKKRSDCQYERGAVEPDFLERRKPVMVVHAISLSDGFEITEKQLRQKKLLDRILACFAIHKQYLEENLNQLVEDTKDESFRYYSLKGEKWNKRNDFLAMHVFCCALGDLKPIAFQREGFLKAKYGDFYRQYDCSQIRKLAEKLNVEIDLTIKEDNIVIKTFSQEDYSKFWYELYELCYRLPLVHRLKSIQDVTNENEFTFALELVFSIKFKVEELLIPLAKVHPNPAIFLMDHQYYWNEYAKYKYIPLITERDEFFEHPPVLNFLSDILIEGEDNPETLVSAIEGMGRALQIPNLRKRVEKILIRSAEAYGEEDCFYIWDKICLIEQRSAARNELMRFIDEPEIRELFQKWYDEEKIIQLKFELQNALEGIGHHKTTLLGLVDYKPQKFSQDSLEKLKDIILNNSEKPLKIVALRHLVDYFHRCAESWQIEFYDIENNGYGPTLLNNQQIRKNILQFLKELIENQWTNDAEVEQEAQKVFDAIRNHLMMMILKFDEQEVLFEEFTNLLRSFYFKP